MDFGFETIGNACLIVHDNGPLLATDPWIRGTAYFGSWVTSHEIPNEQLENVKAAEYLWISHGHPDHLSHESLEELRDKKILLADHYGGRIARDLRADGFDVTVMTDGQWTKLSDRVRILTIGDIQQDSILLVDMDGKLIVNSNDASDLGAGSFVHNVVSQFDISFLLCLTGYGDADMINFFDEDGERIPPPALLHEPLLDGIESHLKQFGIRYYVPFSAQHSYQRSDSVWAESCATPLSAYEGSFHSKEHEMLPPFCRFDLLKQEASSISPPKRPGVVVPCEEFGDNWSDELESGDAAQIEAYLRPITHLQTFLGFINFRVGGRDNRIVINPDHKRGVTFEAPRYSLMKCIEWNIFDDLMIGNYVKTTLHGPWKHQGTAALYPDFIPFIGKYADNAGARTPAELKKYFDTYRERGFLKVDDPDARAAIEQYSPAP